MPWPGWPAGASPAATTSGTCRRSTAPSSVTSTRGRRAAHRRDRQNRPVLPARAHHHLRQRPVARLAAEQHLRRMDRETFVDRLTYFAGEINALHPFRDGNGRTQRAFLGQLARDADHHLSWSRLDRHRNTEAFAASLNGDDAPLRELLAGLVDVPRR